MKGLPITLFKTFIFSTILAIVANIIYYAYMQRNTAQDYAHVVQLVSGGTFFLTVILTIMSSPMLFLANINYWNSVPVRLLLYFSGSIAFIVTVLLMPLSMLNKLFDLIAVAIFILVHFFFYVMTVRKARLD
jgi:hypothetical protein